MTRAVALSVLVIAAALAAWLLALTGGREGASASAGSTSTSRPSAPELAAQAQARSVAPSTRPVRAVPEVRDEPPPSDQPTATGAPDPRVAAIEARFAEAGAGTPALRQRERDVHALLEQARVSDRVESLECREALCAIALRGESGEALDALLAVPGLDELTTLAPDSAATVRGGTLIAYFELLPPPVRPGARVPP